MNVTQVLTCSFSCTHPGMTAGTVVVNILEGIHEHGYEATSTLAAGEWFYQSNFYELRNFTKE